jgi:hypothetical protein
VSHSDTSERSTRDGELSGAGAVCTYSVSWRRSGSVRLGAQRSTSSSTSLVSTWPYEVRCSRSSAWGGECESGSQYTSRQLVAPHGWGFPAGCGHDPPGQPRYQRRGVCAHPGCVLCFPTRCLSLIRARPSVLAAPCDV